jgi:hypothetical protein
MAEPARETPRPKPRARRPRPAAKQVVVPYWVEISSDMLPATAREAFLRATASWEGFRTHTYDHQGIGIDGMVRLARFDPRFRLSYRESPTRVDVAGIVNEAAIAEGHIAPYPLPPVRGRRPKPGSAREAV